MRLTAGLWFSMLAVTTTLSPGKFIIKDGIHLQLVNFVLLLVAYCVVWLRAGVPEV